MDTTENNRYIYKGADPNNYIVLSNELYRIISLESDNKIKVIKEKSIGTMKYDGKIGANPVSNAYQVRPAFYITADINLCGSGSESNPYTIVS